LSLAIALTVVPGCWLNRGCDLSEVGVIDYEDGEVGYFPTVNEALRAAFRHLSGGFPARLNQFPEPLPEREQTNGAQLVRDDDRGATVVYREDGEVLLRAGLDIGNGYRVSGYEMCGSKIRAL
jgi:hypothetical protein